MFFRLLMLSYVGLLVCHVALNRPPGPAKI
jgi:hypothetical protein